VVVNRAFVRAYLGGADPVGLTFGVGFEPGVFRGERTIVGVVSDTRLHSLRQADVPAYYSPVYDPRGFVVVSTTLSDPRPLIPAVLSAVHAVDPAIPVEIEALSSVWSRELARHRLGLILMSLFAAASLLLAGVGVHGVVGHSAALRSREFAIRAAVGAGPRTLAASVLREGLTLWTLGTSIGIAFAYAAGQVGSQWLYQVDAGDPSILLAATSAVSVLSFTAFAGSALKGSRIKPGKYLAVR
jgi:ABC-type antimicrobial peptide transport system permease subunit